MEIVSIRFRELSYNSDDSQTLPSLKDYVADLAQDHEEDIARYLEIAPSYSAVGKIVGDVLDPSAKAVLFPGSLTDGYYVWPSELAYYVRKYHVRVPQGLIERMKALNWQPPAKGEIDWKRLYRKGVE